MAHSSSPKDPPGSPPERGGPPSSPSPQGGPPSSPEKPADASGRRGRPRIVGVAIPLVLILLLLAAAAYWYVELRGVIETDDATVEADRMTVSTTVFGRITGLGADEGDTVQVGQLLVQLDDADLRSRIAQAEARLSLAGENVKLAEVDVRRSQEDYDRALVQFNGEAIPKEQLDHASSTLAASQARHSIALAQVQTARADLAVVRSQLDDTRVLSPFKGVVARRWMLEGEVVQPGQPILTVYDSENVWITAYFEETKLRSIPLGARAEVSVDAYPDQLLEGTVVLIGAAAASQFSLIPPNNASGNFTKVTQRVPIRVEVDPPVDASGETSTWPRLLPGMSVVVTVLQEEE